MRGRLAALALTLGLLLTGCAAGERASVSEFAPEEGERLVVYTSHKEEVYWPIIQEFEARTGIWVEVEAGGTSELLARLRREADAPAADVMFGGGVDSLEAYQDCFSPYFCAGWEGLDPAMRSEEGLWTPFSALPVVLIYNTKLVVPGQITGWRDLFSPAWQGRIAFCDPSVSGSSFTGLITLLRAVDGDTDETLMRFAVSLDGRQLDSSGAVLDSVAGGTDLVGITLEETALKRAAAGEDIALIYPVMATAADYFPEDAVVVLSESPRVAERGKSYLWQLGEDAKALMERGELAGELADFARTFEELTEVLADWPVCYLDAFTSSRYPQRPRTLLNLLTKQLPSYGASLETAVSDLAHYVSDGFRTVVLVSSEQRALNLQALLREQKMTTAVDFQLHELPGYGKAVIAVGGLTAGMEYPVGRFAVLTEGQSLLGKKRRSKPVTNRQKLGSYADLSPGDLVVHEHHGVGRFLEMTKMTVDGVQKDYVKIAYAGADVLYVPATQLDLVSKYIGSGEDAQETRKLSRLGGTDWEKAKTRAKKAVKDLAKGLIQLYAERQRQPGFAFSPDSPWMKEFEDEFEYAETDDQLRCIAEIKQDMEQARPMDRLLCGDVGYGKTEVAFRAIMKCVLDGKQAAILVPTTVLARQHYLTAKQRFAKYPVEIDVVSRFRTQTQMKDTLRRLEQGGIDLLIGTHRLFQKDVKFKDLGLLVIDEEQRFGVQHKEKLKELSKQVDVLTLSATPIPRTLNMALSGIRDMSTLEEPPMDRQPVQTYVLEHDWGVLSDAMRRELERGGQVYYLHNRVETITRTAARIKEMLGEDVAVAVAHGKMSQEELNDVMTRMSDGEVDVLVCTTIIETGIDIANANTLIIEDADHMGLAQLHQIRGRVGRSTRRAYAYLTYRRGKVLTEVASKRLGAIREFAEFGSGFKIAMRDLEIRGAGNVLGPEQSGFLLSVGYDMYLKLLEEAVLEERGEKPERPTECAADLSVAASIPDRYVPSPEQRMDLYRRIAAIRSEADADDVMDELIDRYGDPPRTVNNLISVALLRADAARNGISQIDQKGANLNFYLDQFDLQRVSALCGLEKYRSRLLFSAGERPYLALRLKKGEDALKFGRRLVEDYAKTAPDQTEG